MLTRANIEDRLIDRIPEFDEIYKEHLNDNQGEVLQHPLFAELMRFTIEAYRLSIESTERSHHYADVFERILCFVEDAAQSGDGRVVELVQLSFMENLHQSGPHYEAISSRLKPASRKLLEVVEQEWTKRDN